MIDDQLPEGGLPGGDETIERLAGLCRLWGVAEYFHPRLAYRDVDWDAALVETLPAVAAAESPEAYREAIDRFLGRLGDPVTRTLPPEGGEAGAGEAPEGDGTAGELAVHRAGGVAVVVATDYERIATPAGGATLRRLLEEAVESDAEALVFDLRRRRGGAGTAWRVQVAVGEVLPRLIDRPVPAAGRRHRLHSGQRDQRGLPFGGYYAAVVVEQGQLLLPAPAPRARRHLAFVLDSGAGAPLAALAGLQAAGLATVVWEGVPDAEAGVAVASVALGGGLRAQVRRDELVSPDGRAGFRPDATVPRSAAAAWPGNAAVAAAVEAVGRAPAAPPPVPDGQGGPAPAERVRASAVRSYPQMAAPAPPYRLLALFRFWNAICYFFPYLHLLERDWEDVLRAHLPAFARAGDAEDYALCVARLAAETRDTHAFVGSRALRRFLGTHGPPVVVREVEGQTVVTHLLGDAAGGAAGPPGGAAVGDVVVAVDGEPAGARRVRLAPLLAASTPQALRWRLDRVLLAGAPDSAVGLTVRGAGGATREVVLRRSVVAPQRPPRTLPVYGRLPEGFGYVDLERLTVPQVDDAFAALLDAPGLIFDLRGYPHSTAWPIAPWLTEREVVTARFRALERHGPDPDAYSERHYRQRVRPNPKGRYRGKVVVLIDEEAISQAEHSCLFLEAAAGATFIGGPTNGANGDVTGVVLPGGVSVGFSGQEVTHADGRQLQRVGIQPHLRVEPTVAGVRAGRDEVLEAAVGFLRDHAGGAPPEVAPGARRRAPPEGAKEC